MPYLGACTLQEWLKLFYVEASDGKNSIIEKLYWKIYLKCANYEDYLLDLRHLIVRCNSDILMLMGTRVNSSRAR